MTGELPRTGRSAVGTSWQPTSERTSQAYNCQKRAPAAFNIMLPATLLQNPDRAKGRLSRAKGQGPIEQGQGPRANVRRMQGQGPTSEGCRAKGQHRRANIRFTGNQQRFSQLPGYLCQLPGYLWSNFRGAFCNLLILKELFFQVPKSVIWQPNQPFGST